MSETEEKDMIYIPDEQYNSLIDKVLKVPVKKRKNWKYLLCDKWGTKTKLIYKEGKLMNYSLFSQKFEEVVPQSKIEEMKKDPEIHFTPSSDFAKRCEFAFTLIDNSGCSDEDKAILKNDIHKFLVDKEIEDNHTGNHYRNHYVNVGSNVYGNHSI